MEMTRRSSLLPVGRWRPTLLIITGLLVALAVAVVPAKPAAASTDTQTIGGQVLGDPDFGNLAVFLGGGHLTETFYSVAQNRWSFIAIPGNGDARWNPVAIGNPNGGNMAVFYTSDDDKLFYDYFFGATQTWASTPIKLSDDSLGSPAVLGDPNGGNIAVFWGDSHQHLNERFYFGASNIWSAQFVIASGIDSSPAALGNPNGGNIALFYTSFSQLVESYYFSSTNSWNPPLLLARDVKGAPTALGDPNAGNIAVFYTTNSHTNDVNLHHLQEMYYTGAANTWGGPYTLPRETNLGPFAAIGDPNHGKIAVYSEIDGIGIFEDLYDPATNAWSNKQIVSDNVITQPVAVGDPNGGNRAVFFSQFFVKQSNLAYSYYLGSTGQWAEYIIS
jgi:hypothetical protein